MGLRLNHQGEGLHELWDVAGGTRWVMGTGSRVWNGAFLFDSVY